MSSEEGREPEPRAFWVAYHLFSEPNAAGVLGSTLAVDPGQVVNVWKKQYEADTWVVVVGRGGDLNVFRARDVIKVTITEKGTA